MYSSSLKGPEPIATCDTSLLFASMNAFDMTMHELLVIVERNDASGSESVISTVAGSTALMPSSVVALPVLNSSAPLTDERSDALVEAVAGSSKRVYVNTTSSAVTGVPSENIALARRWKV